MQCPKCTSTQLESKHVGDVAVDRCPKCHGAWFDSEELARLLSLDRAELKSLIAGSADAAANARRGSCPRDGANLLRVASPKVRQVVLDVCPQCRGVWLDGGEFARLRAGS